MYSRIVFWEPMLSPHKVGFISSVSDILGVECVYVAHEGLDSERLRQGWRVASNDLPCYVAPDKEEIKELIKSREALHVFSGIRNFSTITFALNLVLKEKLDFFIMSEPRVFEGGLGFIRLLQSRLCEYSIRNSVTRVLAIGVNGVDWFKLVGYDLNRILPFAYFIPDVYSIGRREGSVAINIGFLGRLVESKGCSLFLEAATQNNNPKYNFFIAGSGSLESECERACKDGKVFFQGVIDMKNVPSYLSSLDVLVLPSNTKNDGWGVVVNEALLSGVAVVLSGEVGASLVVKRNWIGKICNSRDSKSIIKAVDDMVDEGVLNEKYKQKRRNFALENLTSLAGAKYFSDIVRSVTDKAKVRSFDWLVR